MIHPDRTGDAPADPERAPQPSQPLAILTGDLPESFDDDLAWILSKYVDRTEALGGVLTLHHADGRAADLLYLYGPIAESPEAIEEIGRTAARASWGDMRGEQPIPQWDDVDVGGRQRALSLPLAADAQQRVVLTTVHPAEPNPVGEAMAMRLQPVLAGYFKLWLLNRTFRRRMDGLASALNRTDIAILLLDGASRIVFVNDAARGLLDDVDGVRRVGHGMAATDPADAVKLRVAIEHVVALGRCADHGGGGDGRSPVVPLRRRDGRRALIAAVLPVDKPAASPADPMAILYIFTPDINVGQLLVPICQVYALSPSETRLVGILAEGLSVTEAAERMRVKVPTLRTYLKQIFAKTGTARQGDLMRMMMGGLVRTRHEGGHKLL